MPVSSKHVLSQGAVIAALARAAVARPHANGKPCPIPGSWVEAELPPRAPALVRDYVRSAGGDPSWYRGALPPHMFPQWAFPLAARAMAGLPYPLVRVVNAGCRMEVRAPLPADERLAVRARVERVDEDDRRVIVTTRVVTGTAKGGDALVADMTTLVPLAKKNGSGGGEKRRVAVPASAREIAFLRIAAGAGLDFAKLTGDFNPIHWLAPYARAMGFRSCILHGFATLARAIEALNRARFAGDATRLAAVEARFTRPLVLPAKVGVYVDDRHGLWVGDAPGGGAYLEGRYETERLS